MTDVNDEQSSNTQLLIIFNEDGMVTDLRPDFMKQSYPTDVNPVDNLIDFIAVQL